WTAKLFGGVGEHHWPTFNVADIAICVGVGLMAVDMFTSKRGPRPVLRAPHVPPPQSGEPVPGGNGAPKSEPGPDPPAPSEAGAPAPPAEPPAEAPPTG